MFQRSLAVLGAVAGVCGLATACGSRSQSAHTASGSGGGATVVKIGLDAPLTGGLQALGLGMQYSAQLAVDLANKQQAVPGVTFQLVAKDDQASASIGEQNAAAYVADPGVAGVVGPLNSAVAQSMQSVFNQANLVDVSSASTNPSLTQGPNWKTAKTRAYPSFFRDITTDAVQGPFAADYVFKTLGIHSVATVDDGQTYGVGLVETFSAEFKKLGGQIALAQTATANTTDYSSVISAVKSSGAKLVYYGGEYPAGAPLSKELKAAGLNIPEMGGDGNQDPTYIKTAGPASNGDFATVPGAPLAALPSAKDFIAQYQAAHFPAPYAIYGGTSYDAAESIILSVKAALAQDGGKMPAGDAFRSQVEKAEQAVSFDGATGPVAFDQYGDVGSKVITMYKIENGAWDQGVYSGAFAG
ncbi:branched-chain amino acid ABC transporter substrate-binding protein [Catenulispora pinisilvae]|uniref:branched-chain amino acid ABC transporter substrate-binding protein n=1 Tax=Catenulispora pinisilvae TaxID=2705253 RepID=UPI001891C372|nr:branched-chain amino acid ABC transporter substrate-binding protein [Catenulispora pinisilvae]